MFIAEDGRLVYDWDTGRWHGPYPLPGTRR
jgi:hypothetical protein